MNTVADNANGSDSMQILYQILPRLSLFHYQCSKETTSKEIGGVFEKASQRQKKMETGKDQCFVFMDEAGLPEEEKESLKVLHYLLEGHMSKKPDVGFVAITNHVLDAAKSNRCVSLLREEPDNDEMKQLTRDVLFHHSNDEALFRRVEIDEQVLTPDDFAGSLYQSYRGLLHNDPEFSNFFGLRDFIYLLKAIKAIGGSDTTVGFTITREDLRSCVARNFNGNGLGCLERTLAAFLSVATNNEGSTRPPHTMTTLQDALESKTADLSTKPRFKLIIDQTNDDSIARLLHSCGLVQSSRRSLFKLSHLPDDFPRAKIRLITGIKFAAQQAGVALLSQTSSINESFYDLFNQHFRAISRNGKQLLYANIAVGGVSRRSLVSSDFECIVHVRAKELDEMPAPFMNRFEKYSLSIKDVIEWGLEQSRWSTNLFDLARQKTQSFIETLGESGLLGCDDQTVDSLLAEFVPFGVDHTDRKDTSPSRSSVASFEQHLCDFLQDSFGTATAATATKASATAIVDLAKKHFRSTDGEALRQVLDGRVPADSIGESFQSVFDPNSGSSTLSSLCRRIVLMFMVQTMTTKLLQITKPEVLYAKR